jgi:hypothetical protein
LKRFYPIVELVIALAVLAIRVAIPISEYSRLRLGAPFTYALDDAYIHMAMAANLSNHGVYGVTAHAFTSSSSSPLWTVLLALVYKVFGVSELAPMWLNLVCGFLTLYAAWLLIGKLAPDRTGMRLAGMLALVFLIPLPALILSGMETTLQIFFTLVFVSAGVAALQASSADSFHRPGSFHRPDSLLLGLGILFGAVRYESLALVGLVCFLLLLRRRTALALALAACALLPTVIYGLISVSHGWWFFPNSVLVKVYEPVQNIPQALYLLFKRAELMWTLSYLRVLWIGVAAGLLVEWKWPAREPGVTSTFRWLVVLFLPALAAQVLLGHLNWFYRYEAYVLALGIVMLAGLWGEWLYRFQPRSYRGWMYLILVVAGLFFAFPLWERGYKAQQEIPVAMTNIYDQQIQMARFVKRYYAGGCVAINDIGAVSFMGDACVIDLAGLATQETALASIENRPLRPVFEQLVRERQARLVMIYTTWFPGEIPSEWVEVGSWTVARNVVLGHDTVTFYAPSAHEAETLRLNLEAYSEYLPASVRR